ncbi:MAG: hypothetical protein WBW88_08575, partial [Rhodothermales bacterium]
SNTKLQIPNLNTKHQTSNTKYYLKLETGGHGRFDLLVPVFRAMVFEPLGKCHLKVWCLKFGV